MGAVAVPPAESSGERTLAVIAFEIAAVQRDVDRLRVTIDGLRTEMVRHDVWDIAQGANRVDLGKLELELQALEKALEVARGIANGQHDKLGERISNLKEYVVAAVQDLKEVSTANVKALEEKITERSRQLIRLLVTAFIAPLVVGGILLIVSLTGGR